MDGWCPSVVLKLCCPYRISLLQIFFVVLDFSLTVKTVTLIFISGRASAISSTKHGKSGSIYNLVKNNKLFGPRKRACIS